MVGIVRPESRCPDFDAGGDRRSDRREGTAEVSRGSGIVMDCIAEMANKGLYRIFAVEDNAADVFLMREALKQHEIDADLLVFTNGQSAMSYFAAINQADAAPELILLDVNLPRRNGLAVLESLRANPLLQSVPVVIFTSSESAQDR